MQTTKRSIRGQRRRAGALALALATAILPAGPAFGEMPAVAATGPQLSLNWTSLDFGSVQVGTSATPISATVRNVSGTPAGPLTPSLDVVGNYDQFSETSACDGATLAPGATCTMTFGFTPTAAGIYGATFQVGFNGQTWNVGLAGTGLPPSLTVTSQSLDFGVGTVGIMSATRSVAIQNTGLAPVKAELTGITIGPDYNLINWCNGTTVQPGASCYLILGFQPTAAVQLNEAISFTLNGLYRSVELKGWGAVAGDNTKANQLGVVPDRWVVDFGPTTVGAGATATIRLVNLSTSNQPITWAAPTLLPGTSITQNCGGATLAPKASCTVTLAYDPTGPGTLDGSELLHIVGNGWASFMTFHAYGSAVLPRLQFSPRAIDFGTVAVGTVVSDGVTITNQGPPVALGLSAISPLALPFAAVGGVCPSPLPRGASCVLSFAFAPTLPGPAIGTFAATISGTVFAVNLSGVGASPNPSVLFTQVRIRSGYALSGSKVPVLLRWVGTPGFQGAQIASYQLARSIDSKVTWAPFGAATTSASTGDFVPAGGTIAYAVMATDGDGKPSTPSTTANYKMSLFQEAAGTAVYKGTWSKVTYSKLSGGHSKVATAKNASVAFTAKATGIGIVATRGPGYGKANVYLDGKFMATIDLKKSVKQYKVIVWSTGWLSMANHTVKLVVLGTPGRPKVEIDGFVALQ